MLCRFTINRRIQSVFVEKFVTPRLKLDRHYKLICLRDCAIIIRKGGGGGELEGEALHEIAAKIGGLKVKSII